MFYTDNTKFIPFTYTPPEKQFVVEYVPKIENEQWAYCLSRYLSCCIQSFEHSCLNPHVSNDIKNWLKTLYVTIPCEECSRHVYNFINNYDLNVICSDKNNILAFLSSLIQNIAHCSGELNITNPSNPDTWGPYLWKYIHLSTANFPDHPSRKQEKDFKIWLSSLGSMLPCKYCSQHYRHALSHYGPLSNVRGKEQLFKYMVDIHNDVNIRNGKPYMSYAEAWDLYG